MTPLRVHFVEPVIFRRNRAEMIDGIAYRRCFAAGDAHWTDYEGGSTILSFSCPCGCKRINMIAVYQGKTGHGWHWDGNRERPTLFPSIQLNGGCRWHGFLTRGYWVLNPKDAPA